MPVAHQNGTRPVLSFASAFDDNGRRLNGRRAISKTFVFGNGVENSDPRSKNGRVRVDATMDQYLLDHGMTRRSTMFSSTTT